MNHWQPEPKWQSEPKPAWTIVPYEEYATVSKRQRLCHLDRVARVVDLLRRHDYVVILGPAYSDKTRLMHDVNTKLADGEQFTPLYINLWRVRTDDEAAFFGSLAQTILRSERLEDTLPEAGRWAEMVVDATTFRHFLDALLKLHDRHLALLIDHLQSLPHDLTHRLLQLLRAAYMERSAGARLLDVVVAGSAVLAELSHDATSPFNMAHPVFQGPLSDEASLALINANVDSYGVPWSPHAPERLLYWAGGDSYLLPRLVAQCHDKVAGFEKQRITQTVVDQTVRSFLATAHHETPLSEAIRAIEDDPDTMLDVVTLLNQPSLPRNQAHQQILRTGVDRLQLCGAVFLQGDEYRIKNEIYRQALRRHFVQGRVAHVLRMNGRWHEAITYLSTHGAGVSPQPPVENGERADLLEAIIQSIYAANREQEAYASLLAGIRLGFHLSDVRIYRAYAGRGELRLVAPDGAQPVQIIDLNDESLAEVRTFRGGNSALRGEPGSKRLLAALVPERRAIGLVVIERYSTETSTHSTPIYPVYHGELLRFLRHASSAIENVVLRDAMQEIGRAVLNASAVNSNLEQVLQTVLNAAGGDAALLYLLDDAQTRLVQSVQTGDDAIIRSAGERSIELALASHPAVMALQSGGFTPVRPSTPPELRAYLPLSAGGAQLGVLALFFAAARQGGFSQDDRKMLSTFADQVAIAVHNLQLLRRTDEALQEKVRQLEVMRRRAEQVRDQELLDVANAVVHRLGDAAGDVPYHLSLIRDGIPSGDEALLDALEHVEVRFRRLADLGTPLEEIIDMADITLHPLELAGLVQEVVDELLPKDDRLLVEKQLERGIMIEGHRSLLHDALFSILDNGREAMPGGGVLKVSVSQAADGRAVVRVADHGQGIAEAYKARMFEPGFSTKPVLDANRSRGRGLFTCRAIVRKHKGEIVIASAQGVGTEVTITLPVLGKGL
jgi:signal transduction histidine kinase